MKVTIEPLARPYLLKIVENDKDLIKEEMDKIWNKNKKNIDGIKGFRKGKAPRDVAEKNLGLGNLYRDLIDIIFNKSMTELEEKIVDVKEYGIDSFSKELISFKVLVDIKPKVLSSKYKQTEVEMDKGPIKVTKEQVDATIERVRESQATEESADIVKMGNQVMMDFEGFIDGKAFEGGKAVKHKSNLSPTSFIPGFAEQIVGMKVGENKDIDVKFPEDYHGKAVAGKDAIFKIKVHEISKKKLPELDDEFAKTNNFETMEEMIKDNEEKLEKNSKQQHRAMLQHNVLSEIIKQTETEPIPEIMISKTAERMLQDQIRYTGMSEEEFFKVTKSSKEKFITQQYYAAKNDLIGRLILEHVAETEDFEITEEETNEYLNTESTRLGMEIDKLKNMLPGEGIAENLKVKKAFEFICDNAVIVEPKKPEVKKENNPSEGEAIDAKESETKTTESSKEG